MILRARVLSELFRGSLTQSLTGLLHRERAVKQHNVECRSVLVQGVPAESVRCDAQTAPFFAHFV